MGGVLGWPVSVSPCAVTELVLPEELEEDKEHTCETLLMCIVTVLSHGLRSGGGVGDVLRKPSKEVRGQPAMCRARAERPSRPHVYLVRTRKRPARGCCAWESHRRHREGFLSH